MKKTAKSGHISCGCLSIPRFANPISEDSWCFRLFGEYGITTLGGLIKPCKGFQLIQTDFLTSWRTGKQALLATAVLSLRFSTVCRGFPPVAALERGVERLVNPTLCKFPFGNSFCILYYRYLAVPGGVAPLIWLHAFCESFFFLSPSSTGRIRLFGECANTRSIHLP
ncbi:MAG: hypothetical protein PUD50_06125 [Eubacteriales bacterium]|nr:hypothetical protein [Eubacteriales bacterium]